MSDAPRLSVVIAASDSLRAVATVLSALLPDEGIEVVVVAAADSIATPEMLPDGVRWVVAHPGATVPRLRWLGAQASRGEVIVFTEDSCVPQPGWAAAWTRSFADAGGCRGDRSNHGPGDGKSSILRPGGARWCSLGRKPRVDASNDNNTARAGDLDPLGERAEIAIAADDRGVDTTKPGLSPQATPARPSGANRTELAPEQVSASSNTCRTGVLPGQDPGYPSSFSIRSGVASPVLLAATGPVECPDASTLLDQAVFFCEYAPFLPPWNNQTTRLAGNNFAVKRELLRHFAASQEIEESVVSQIVAASGQTARVIPEAIVCHTRQYTLRQAIADRLRLGYSFGRLRASQASRPIRIALGPAIIASQAARLAITLIAKRRLLDEFIESLPLTLTLLTAWSVGEWLGLVRGPAHQVACTSHETAAQTEGQRRARAAFARRRDTTAPAPA